MELIRIKDNNCSYIAPMAVCLGQFDGLHVAHYQLLLETKRIAKEQHLKSGIVTFDPHPDFVLKKQVDDNYITPLNEKIEVLSELGLDYMIIINFNLTVASLEPKEFVTNYLCKIGVKAAVVGFDFTYGKYGSGKAQSITSDSNNRIQTTIIDEIRYKDQKIGSSMIRKLLAEGLVEQVKSMLGRYYQVEAEVVRGNQIGHTIGIPTANLNVDKAFVGVKPGVYAVRVSYLNKIYLGVCNLGHNPSFNYQNKMTLEVHIIDFNEQIYGKTLKVEFLKYLRSETKFPSVLDFQKQIKKDIETTKQLKI